MFACVKAYKWFAFVCVSGCRKRASLFQWRSAWEDLRDLRLVSHINVSRFMAGIKVPFPGGPAFHAQFKLYPPPLVSRLQFENPLTYISLLFLFLDTTINEKSLHYSSSTISFPLCFSSGKTNRFHNDHWYHGFFHMLKLLHVRLSKGTSFPKAFEIFSAGNEQASLNIFII